MFNVDLNIKPGEKKTLTFNTKDKYNNEDIIFNIEAEEGKETIDYSASAEPTLNTSKEDTLNGHLSYLAKGLKWIKSQFSKYLPLAGGTMSGDIDMGGKYITNGNWNYSGGVVNKNSLYSPLITLWHDRVLFGQIGYPKWETFLNDTLVSTETNFKKLFIGKDKNFVTVLNDNITKSVFTWEPNYNQICASHIEYIVFNVAYSYPSTICNVKIEGCCYEYGETEFRTLGECNFQQLSNKTYICRLDTPITEIDTIRITVSKIDGASGKLNLSSINFLTGRLGDQGGGRELSNIFSYDVNLNTTFPAKLTSQEPINYDAVIEPTQTGNTVTKTNNWVLQYLVQGINWLKSKKQDSISDLATIRSRASNGNTAYSWGNHANVGYVTATSLATMRTGPSTVISSTSKWFDRLINNYVLDATLTANVAINKVDIGTILSECIGYECTVFTDVIDFSRNTKAFGYIVTSISKLGISVFIEHDTEDVCTNSYVAILEFNIKNNIVIIKAYRLIN